MDQTQLNYKATCAPNFTSYYKIVEHNKFHRPISTNNTWFFRTDINWDKFAEKLIEKYRKTDKVKIHCYACSNGAEPFSLAMMLIKKLGDKKAQKFFPIIASDIDTKILRNPKQGKIKLSENDIAFIKYQLGYDYYNFIEHSNKFVESNDSIEKLCDGIVKPIIRDAVDFHKSNVFEDVANIEKDNSVVMCRNVWPYFLKEDQRKLARTLSNQLGDSSMCVIGDYDAKNSLAEEQLIKRGFKYSDVKLCFEKQIPEKQTYLSNPAFLMTTYAKSNISASSPM